MRYREFGNTGLQVSEISFGAMRLTGNAAHVARTTEPSEAEIQEQDRRGQRALLTALDGGVNCIHSSDDYGTRWMLGAVLEKHPRRSDIHHVIKVSTPDHHESEFNAHQFRRNVEEALTDLHAERISFVQHLQRGPNVSKEDAYSEVGDAARISALPRISGQLEEIMTELRDAGKVGHLITFPHTIGYAQAAMAAGPFAGVAHFFNLIETEGLDILDDLVANGHGYFAIRPLLQGMLTDGRVHRAILSEGDPKSRSNWDTRYALLDRIRAVIGEPDTDWTTFALKFALAHPGVTSLITSANSEEQMRSLLNASEGAYPSLEVVDTVRAIARETRPLPKSDLFVENLLSEVERP